MGLNRVGHRVTLAITSLVILIFLGLQTIALLGLYRGRLWPFVDYPMYRHPHYEGDSIDRYFLFGISEDNTEMPISAEDLGLNFWKFLWGFVPAVVEDRREQIEVYIDFYRTRHNKVLLGLRLENHPLVLSRNGLSPAPVQVVKTIRLKSQPAQP